MRYLVRKVGGSPAPDLTVDADSPESALEKAEEQYGVQLNPSEVEVHNAVSGKVHRFKESDNGGNDDAGSP